MAKIKTLISLVQSLTKGEKKYITMHASVQKGSKDYLRLFRLISNGTEHPQLKKAFLRAKHTASYETSCKYLFSLLIKYLMQIRQDKDVPNQLLHDLIKTNLLFKKSLYDEGFMELKKIKKKAAGKELHLIELAACRLELNYHIQLNFNTLTEKQLILLQMHMEELIRRQSQEQQHHKLYALMKYRSFHKGTTRSAQQTGGFNDLVVSEMSLLNISPDASFQTEKAHLLFQSNYFLTTNDFASALKVFYQLNELFEKNRALWKEQPADYLSMLEGILHSLRMVGKFDDLTFFLNKIRKLNAFSPSAQLSVEKMIYVYDLILLLDTGDFPEALVMVKTKNSYLFRHILLLDVTQQAEVYLYTAITCFVNNDLKKSQQHLRSVLLENKHFYNLPVYKTFRLIRLLVHYQLNDHEYIRHEVRSIKRSMQKEKYNSYMLEKTLLKFLQIAPLPAGTKERTAIWDKLKPQFDLIKKDKYELQLLKIFDFSVWLQSILTKQSFSQLLKEKNINNKSRELHKQVKEG